MNKKEVELPGTVIVSTRYGRTIEVEIQKHREGFVKDFMDRKQAELGWQKFEEKRSQLAEEAAKCWELAQQGKRLFHELEERSHVKIMKWSQLEKPLRQWLENQAVGEGWPKEMVEKTVVARRKDFERSQRIVQGRLRPKPDPDQDFRERVLNPATRKEALRDFLQNHVNKSHFTLEAFELLWNEIDNLKAKRR